MNLSETQIDALLRQKSITEEWPWGTNDQRQVEKNIQSLVAQLRRKLRVEDQTEYDHYGSGYASYVDCWLYRPDKQFRVGDGNHFEGLVILFSRLSPFYVIGQGQKSWHERGGSHYLPRFEFVDAIYHEAVLTLVPGATAILSNHGLQRLFKSDLDVTLPKGIRVPTILNERVFRQFDLLFYWED